MNLKKILFCVSCYFIIATRIASAQTIVTPGFTTVNVQPQNICVGLQVSFKDTSAVTFTNWQWTFDGGTPHTSGEQNPVITYDTAGSYNVTLTAWNSSDSGTLTVTRYILVTAPTPLTVTANPSAICAGQSSVLSVTAGNGSYTWSPSSDLSNTAGDTTFAIPAATTTYTVTDTGMCKASGIVVITVGNLAISGFITATTDTLCAGQTTVLKLSGNSSNTIQWQWASANNGVGEFSNIPGAVDTNKYTTEPLSETTLFRVVVGNGSCVDTSRSFQIRVSPTLIAFFHVTAVGNMVSFIADSSTGNITNYLWDFGDGQSSTSPNPTYTYATDGVYTACLTIETGVYCSSFICHTFDLKVLGVNEIAATGNWNVYPSPFTGVINISRKQAGSPVKTLTLYNVLGQAVISVAPGKPNDANIQLDGSVLDKGMYYLEIKTGDATCLQKVVKQ